MNTPRYDQNSCQNNQPNSFNCHQVTAETPVHAFKGNTFPVCVQKVITNALLDTGAEKSCVSYQFLSKLPDFSPNKIKPSPFVCTLANKGTVSTLGVIDLPVYIRNSRYRIELLVLPELNHDIIIGIDFMQKHGAHIRFFGSTSKLFPLFRCTLASLLQSLPAQK